jgi:hypothetical protein
MPSKKHSLNILLDSSLREALTQLTFKWDCSAGAAMRKALRYTYTMVVHDTPTCANGARCFVPQMHTTQTTLPGIPPVHNPLTPE